MEALRFIDQAELYQYIPEEVKERLQARHVLFQAISESAVPEENVLILLEDHRYQKEINQPFKTQTGAETPLMRAVWNLKSKVVKRLLELGADPHFTNDYGSGVGNFWDVEKIKKNQFAAAEIAEMLHHRGVDLSRSLIRKIGPFDFTILEDRLMEMCYWLSFEETEKRIKRLKGYLSDTEKTYDEYKQNDMPTELLVELSDRMMDYQVKINTLEEKKKFCV